MPNLLTKIFGIDENSSGRRPQMLEVSGVNWNCDQASDLVAVFPMWEPSNATMIDYGPLGLVAFPRAQNMLKTNDPQFGNVYTGTASVRPYAVPYNPALDFGLGPNPFSLTFWMKLNAIPASAAFICIIDGNSSFPGYYAGINGSGDTTPSSIFFGTANASNLDDRSFATTRGLFFDGLWHHYAMTHVPGAVNTITASNSIYVDGKLNAFSATRSTVGPVNASTFFIGTDNDGIASPFGGTVGTPAFLCDLRIYKSALSGLRCSQMWHPDTRWDLWQSISKRWFFNPNASGPPPTAVTQILKGGILNSPLISSGGICS